MNTGTHTGNLTGPAVQRSPLGEAFTIAENGDKTQFLRAPSGKPLAYRMDDQNAYLVQDRQGSVIGVLDDTAAKVVSYGYDPYGNIRSAPGIDSRLAWGNTLTYTGAMRDLQTGLYRFGVRWYDPNTGRFTTPDPTSQENNAYLYALGNPCNNIDPDGGNPVCWMGGAVAAYYVGKFLGNGTGRHVAARSSQIREGSSFLGGLVASPVAVAGCEWFFNPSGTTRYGTVGWTG